MKAIQIKGLPLTVASYCTAAISAVHYAVQYAIQHALQYVLQYAVQRTPV